MNVSCIIFVVWSKTLIRKHTPNQSSKNRHAWDNNQKRTILRSKRVWNKRSNRGESAWCANLCRKMCPETQVAVVRSFQHPSHFEPMGLVDIIFTLFWYVVRSCVDVPMLLSNEVLVAHMARCWTYTSGLLWRFLRQNALPFLLCCHLLQCEQTGAHIMRHHQTSKLFYRAFNIPLGPMRCNKTSMGGTTFYNDTMHIYIGLNGYRLF